MSARHIPAQRIPARLILVSLALTALLAPAGQTANVPLGTPPGGACDTWVALGDATTCGYTILAKNSDRPTFGCQPLVMHPGRKWPSGSTIDLARVTIPQAAETYTTLGSSPYWSWGYEEGINEHSVAIGNEAIWTRVLVDETASHKAGKGPKLGPTGMDLVRLGLERGKTARQALNAIAAVIKKHGQFGSASPTRGLGGAYHNSFIIADPSEAWVLETAGPHWVAKRIAKGTTSISNGVSLGTDFNLTSPDVIQHAITRGWWPADKAKRLHFQHAYSKDTRKGQPVATAVHPRAKISRRLLRKKAPRIDPRWMMHIARSPGINLNATASSCVAVLPNTGDELPVFWWCPAVPSASCYVPFFVHGSGPAKIVSTAGTYGTHNESPSKTGRDKFSDKSYWWLFRDLSDKVRADPKARLPVVREAFDALEKQFEAGLPAVIKQAVRLRKDGRSVKAAAILDAYTTQCLNKVLLKLNHLRGRFGK